jgi:hypothetical protein
MDDLHEWVREQLYSFLAAKRKKNALDSRLYQRLLTAWEEGEADGVRIGELMEIADAVRPKAHHSKEEIGVHLYHLNASLARHFHLCGLEVRIVCVSGKMGRRRLRVQLKMAIERSPFQWRVPYRLLEQLQRRRSAGDLPAARPRGISSELVLSGNPSGGEDRGGGDHPTSALVSSDPGTIDVVSEDMEYTVTPLSRFALVLDFIRRQRVVPQVAAVVGFAALLYAAYSFLRWRGFSPDLPVLNVQDQILQAYNPGLTQSRSVALVPLVNSLIKSHGVAGSQPVYEAIHLRSEDFAAEVRRHFVFADITGDGRNEIIFGTSYRVDRGSPGFVVVLSNQGRLMWAVPMGGPLTVTFQQPVPKSAEYPGHFSAVRIAVNDIDGREPLEIIAMSTVTGYEPSLISVIEPDRDRGEVVQEFYHYGGLNDFLIEDIDGDGAKEILFCGINNQRLGVDRGSVVVAPPAEDLSRSAMKTREKYPYHGAVVGVLRYAPGTAGAAPIGAGSVVVRNAVLSVPANLTYDRLRMADISLRGSYWNQCVSLSSSADRVTALVQDQGRFDSDEWIIGSSDFVFERSPEFPLREVLLHEQHRSKHAALYRAGKLDRDWDAMLPDLRETLEWDSDHYRPTTSGFGEDER